MQDKRIFKRKLGVVVSNAMDKSVTVMVERTVLDPRFKKYVRRRQKFMAHDENNEAQINDTVMIMETRPISKDKRWRLVEIISRAK